MTLNIVTNLGFILKVMGECNSNQLKHCQYNAQLPLKIFSKLKYLLTYSSLFLFGVEFDYIQSRENSCFIPYGVNCCIYIH